MVAPKATNKPVEDNSYYEDLNKFGPTPEPVRDMNERPFTLDETITLVMNERAEDYAKLHALPMLESMSALPAFLESVKAEAAKRINSVMDEKQAKREAKAKLIEAARAPALARFTEAWALIVPALEALEADDVPSVHLAVFRNQDGPAKGKFAEPVLTFGKVSKLPTKGKGTKSTNGGGRSEPLTVNGKEFESANKAIQALCPEVNYGMSRESATKFLTRKGHKVS